MFDWVLNTPLVLTIKFILYKVGLQKKWTLRKSGSRTFRNSGTYAKIHCIGQQHLYDKLEVADFKCDNNLSLKLEPKNI